MSFAELVADLSIAAIAALCALWFALYVAIAFRARWPWEFRRRRRIL